MKLFTLYYNYKKIIENIVTFAKIYEIQDLFGVFQKL